MANNANSDCALNSSIEKSNDACALVDSLADCSMNSNCLSNDSSASSAFGRSPDYDLDYDLDLYRETSIRYRPRFMPAVDRNSLKSSSDMLSDSSDLSLSDQSFDSLSYGQFQPSSRFGYNPLNSSLNQSEQDFFVSF